MIPGDLVRLETVFKEPMPIYSTWGNKVGGGDKPVGKIHPGEIGIVLESTLPRDRKSTRLNSSHSQQSRMPSSA